MKSFYCSINSKRLTTENMGEVLNGVGDLVYPGTDREVHNVFFAFVFYLQSPSALTDRLQGASKNSHS